ncbi:MAG: quinolinate synthase NadA, partial [Methanophagales archaeon]|nr:quinolinate synthase NadA [Methanophagales archaeon]
AMKKHTLEKIEEALEQGLNEVVVPEETAIDARRPIEMMYELA